MKKTELIENILELSNDYNKTNLKKTTKKELEELYQLLLKNDKEEVLELNDIKLDISDEEDKTKELFIKNELDIIDEEEKQEFNLNDIFDYLKVINNKLDKLLLSKDNKQYNTKRKYLIKKINDINTPRHLLEQYKKELNKLY